MKAGGNGASLRAAVRARTAGGQEEGRGDPGPLACLAQRGAKAEESSARRCLQTSNRSISRRACACRRIVAGKQDFARPVETLQRPLFGLLAPPPDQKRLALIEGGHNPRLRDIIREILPWLDRYLGPVTPV
jgi:hypothetical protein